MTAATVAPVSFAARRGRREIALALVVVLGLGLVVTLSRWLDARRPAFEERYEDASLYLPADLARRASLAFNGLAADWYWLRSLQYIGKKVQDQIAAAKVGGRAAGLDRMDAVNPLVLSQLLDMTTTLDPDFTAVYEYAAVVLPAVDAEAAVRLLEKGIRVHPESWYLHQQLAYIHWQRGDFPAAAEAFRRGARFTTAKWMDHMAERMEAKGGDRATAREMYARMYDQASDDQVRQWAIGRLMQLRWFDDRDVLRPLLETFRAREGRCPAAWSELLPALRGARLSVDRQGVPVDPSGAGYVLVSRAGGCDVGLGPESLVPRDERERPL
jgi:tetratricopeptide (TPR) repeat protein